MGIENIHKKEMMLTERFIKGMEEIDERFIVGKRDTENRTAVVSLDFVGMDNGIICHELDVNYGYLQDRVCIVHHLLIKH